MFDSMYGLKLDSVGHLRGWNFQIKKMKIQFKEDYKEMLEPENIKVKQCRVKDLNSMSLV